MRKRVFVIHGWGGYPEEGWFPWLKKELEARELEVIIPVMPNPSEPKIEAWVSELDRIVDDLNENTFFVGHSIGCQAILRYLEKLPSTKEVGGAIFVASWFTLNYINEKEEIIALPWIETPIDFEKLKTHCKNFTAIFSDNDEDVPLENKKLFKQRLNAKIILEHNKGHLVVGMASTDSIQHLMPYSKLVNRVLLTY